MVAINRIFTGLFVTGVTIDDLTYMMNALGEVWKQTAFLFINT